jgi:membrane dipeptidase
MNDKISHRKPIIVDAHQDLAWNMLTLGRNYVHSAVETRQLEHLTDAPVRNGDTLLGWADYQKGSIAIVFATLFAAPARKQLGEWDTQCYLNEAEAHQRYTSQLDAYHRLVDDHPEKFRLLQTQRDFTETLSKWEHRTVENPPVGLVILMENAEGVRSVSELEMWWGRGVRIIGPAWAGTRFCGGTGEPGPLTREGYQLLEGMAGYGFVLDVSHMDEKAVYQAVDFYPGTMIASHANASGLLKGVDSNRFLSDRVLQELLERDALIGVIPYNRFLVPGWRESDGRQVVTLDHLVSQIDYICQMAGDARHVGIGSDFDGGFGWQSVPKEIDTIADLQKLIPLLARKGYTEDDIEAVMGKNWLTLLSANLPESV